MEVVEKLSLMKLAVTVARLYSNLRYLVELPHLPVGLTVNVRGTVAIQEYHIAAMATRKNAPNVPFLPRNLAYVERRRSKINLAGFRRSAVERSAELN